MRNVTNAPSFRKRCTYVHNVLMHYQNDYECSDAFRHYTGGRRTLWSIYVRFGNTVYLPYKKSGIQCH